MQALALNQSGVSYRDDYPVPQAGPGEALIRVRLAGICSTDLEIVKGYTDFNGVMGHEFVGVVEALGGSGGRGAAEQKEWQGKRVVGSINIGCGECDFCLREGEEHCRRRKAVGIHGKDGVFAEYVTLPLENLLVVPDAVPDESAVFTEPLAAAVRIREQVQIRPTARVAVLGPGRLGLLIGQVLSLGGTRVIMLGRREASLALPRQLGLQADLAENFAEASFDLVVEVTGNENGLAQAIRLVRPLGMLILKSTFAGQAAVDISRLVVDEITVVGSRCGPFAPALRLLAREAVAVQPLIEATYPLAFGVAALKHAALPGVRKILLRISPSPAPTDADPAAKE